MSKLLAWIGGVLTALYLALWGTNLMTNWDTFKVLKLNELGDFLGGSFGPLAFLWLVLGYFQQGIELRQNSRALHLQAEELKNSVEQQKALVDVARQEHEASLKAIRAEQERAELATRPIFVFDKSGAAHGSGKRFLDFNLLNRGQACTEVRLGISTLLGGPLSVSGPPQIDYMDGQKGRAYQIRVDSDGNAVGSLSIRYVDVLNREKFAYFRVNVDAAGMSFTPENPPAS